MFRDMAAIMFVLLIATMGFFGIHIKVKVNGVETKYFIKAGE